LDRETEYRRGQRHGRSAVYWENGQIKTEVYFRDDVRHGPYRYWHYDGAFGGESVFEDGTGVLRQQYADGTPMVERPFVDGKEHGVYREWYPSGVQSMEGQYEHGRPVGSYRNWHPNGQLFRKVVRDGFRMVAESTWYADGSKQFAQDVESPPDTLYDWYQNGQKKRVQVRADRGFRTIDAEWFEDGSLEYVATYAGSTTPLNKRAWYEDGSVRGIRQVAPDSSYVVAAHWYPNGAWKSYALDSLQGGRSVHRLWYPSGLLRSERHYARPGGTHELRTFSESDGSLHYHARWYDDSVGVGTFYLPGDSGILTGPVHRVDIWEGQWVHLDSAGSIVDEALYEDGRLIRSTDSTLFRQYLNDRVRVEPQ
ncbi:hypothetical protein GF420_05120, partial [candidate division GN15 bacterium]|nr:hypothetical protein [candidate division GN15 bacterium]